MSDTRKCALCDFFSQSVSFSFTIAVLNSIMHGMEFGKVYIFRGWDTDLKKGSISQVGIRSS